MINIKKPINIFLVCFISGATTVHADVTLSPTDDFSSQGSNSGATMSFSAWAHPFIRFNANSVSSDVDSATLRVFYHAQFAGTTYVDVANLDNWTESGPFPTPAYTNGSGALDNITAPSSSKYIEFDVTNYVKEKMLGNKILSFELSHTSGGWNFINSSESSVNRPELVIKHIPPPVAQQYSGLATVVAQNSPGQNGFKFRMNAEVAADNYSDPIKFDSGPGQTHHHLFIGNGHVNSDTTNDIGETGSNSLQFDSRPITKMEGNGANRSAYWVPVMYDSSNQPMQMGFNQIYYTKAGNIIDDNYWRNNITAPPQGLKIITKPSYNVFNCAYRNDPDTTFFTPSQQVNRPADDPLYHYWSKTGAHEGTSDDTQDFWPPNGGMLIPKCDTSLANNVTMRITFPSCWDGTHLTDQNPGDNNPHDHMAYVNPTTHQCPSGYTLIPTVQYFFWFPIKLSSDNTLTYYLSSDRDINPNQSSCAGGSRGGCTNHGDWMNGWEASVMEKMIDTTIGCLGSNTRHCANGQIDKDNALEDPNTAPLDGILRNDILFDKKNKSYSFSVSSPQP